MLDKTLEKLGYVNMADILTDQAKQEIKKGHTLGFKQEDGSIDHYEITHVNKKSDKFYARKLKHLYDAEELKNPTEETLNQIRKDSNGTRKPRIRRTTKKTR